MLRFLCVSKDHLAAIAREGLPPEAQLVDDFAVIHETCSDCVIVVNALAGSQNGAVAPDALLNVRPYLEPHAVTAAGGCIVRDGMLLLIFRKGVWDLPKGKLEKGESIEACALREVREELGITHLEIIEPIGTTVHGYPHKDGYAVKTTHWFSMTTEESTFTPQEAEGIHDVEWVPTDLASERLGYETLRRFVRILRT